MQRHYFVRGGGHVLRPAPDKYSSAPRGKYIRRLTRYGNDEHWKTITLRCVHGNIDGGATAPDSGSSVDIIKNLFPVWNPGRLSSSVIYPDNDPCGIAIGKGYNGFRQISWFYSEILKFKLLSFALLY